MDTNLLTNDWVPSACTLPTVDRPLRREEFANLFAHDVVSVVEPSPGSARLTLRTHPEVAARAADLAVRETSCCSFFTFELTMSGGEAVLVVSAETPHEDVVAALASRARVSIEGSS